MILPIVVSVNTNDDRIASLCRRYWELDDQQHFSFKVSELSREFAVSTSHLPKLVAQYSTATSIQRFCSQCRAPYVFSSRSDFQLWNARQWPWTCEGCKRKEEEQAAAERLLTQQRYREMINSKYASGSPGPVDPSALSLENAVYLLSFTRLLAVEDFTFARSLDSVKRRFSPTDDLDLQIIRQLYRDGLIAVDPNSRLDAFEGEKAETFYLLRVQWHLPHGANSDSPKDFASELEELVRTDEWPSEWPNMAVDLWKKIALHESLQYLAVALGEHGFALNAGEKTVQVVESLLETYSIAQVYNLIWRAGKDAAAFYVRGGVTKQHAANTVVGGMQRYGERARAEGWPIKPYNRHFDCPQSIISEVLFNAVLRIGDDGFKRIPDKTRLSLLPQFAMA